MLASTPSSGARGYPGRPASVEQRVAFLRRHTVRTPANYVHRPGRTVGQIRGEARLREAICTFLDAAGPELAPLSALQVRERVRALVNDDRSLRWALEAPEGVGVERRLLDLLDLVSRPLGLLALGPVAFPAILLALLLVRLQELRDRPAHLRPTPEHLHELRALEDFFAHNGFTAGGLVKRGPLRRLVMAGVLSLIGFGTRHLFTRDSLAGVKTIHFARWIPLDDHRRVVFASNYDGSMESYNNDFIDLVWWGLNLVFGNGAGYPPTRWLVFGGATREQPFKDYLRRHQIPTPVWYSAYPELTAANIERNAWLRAGLRGAMTEREALQAAQRAGGAGPAAVDLRRLVPPPPLEDVEAADVQGLLARGYGKLPHACYLLLRAEDAAGARAWLAELIAQITPATAAPPEKAVQVAFTHAGLAALGLPEATRHGFSAEFIAGMTGPHRSRFLGDEGDSDPQAWSWGGPGSPQVHAVLLLYALAADPLERLLERHRQRAATHGVRELQRLSTSVLSDREHFGFVDGISQPAIQGMHEGGSPLQTVRAGEFILGYRNEYGHHTPRPLVDPTHPAAALLPADVEGAPGRDFGRNGSYLVMRQLRQDVVAFRQTLAARTRNPDGSANRAACERLAAQMVGRWPDGVPLVKAPHAPDGVPPRDNDFRYHHEDPHGLRCPVGAHIRRANPRDALAPRPGTEGSLAVNRRHRILRRGRIYGPPLGAAPDGARPGLYFVALNANISRQFEFIQHSWVVDPRFNGFSGESDPIAGASRGDNTFVVPGNPVRQRVTGLPRFVTVAGGAYFFLPGIRALRFVAAGG